jgi:hypothetical protein
MSEWRPEGWFNPNISLVAPHTDNHEYRAYEDGASAMLEALLKDGDHITIEQQQNGHEVQYWSPEMNGTFVFIPDEEK